MKTSATLWTLDQAVHDLGVVPDESNEAYHMSPGLSFSGLKHFRKTPAHFRAYLEREDDETGAQRLGTLAHMAILEPERFATAVVKNDLNRNSNAFKDFAEQAAAGGLYVCKTHEYDSVCRMRDGLFRSQTIVKLLSGGKAEQSIRWRDPETGILLRCRPDYLRPDGVAVDIKTFEDLNQEKVERQIHKMLYHWQSAFYLRGINAALKINSNMFAHVFVDTKAWIARPFVLDDASLEKAASEIRPLLNSYAECLKADKWPGYPDEIVTAALPSYAW